MIYRFDAYYGTIITQLVIVYCFMYFQYAAKTYMYSLPGTTTTWTIQEVSWKKGEKGRQRSEENVKKDKKARKSSFGQIMLSNFS